jgi:glycosidase
MEFHVSRTARDQYEFDQTLYTFSGNVIFANFRAAREFAQKMNLRRDLVNQPEQAVSAGQINAMGLIDEILHGVIGAYRQERNPQVMHLALDWLSREVGVEELEAALLAFTEQFPPLSVYRGEMSPAEYLAGETAGASHREIALEELIMLWLANANPAFSPFQELFSDAALSQQTAYGNIISNLWDFFETQAKFGPDNLNLIDLLRAPALASPDSLFGQLEFLRSRWSNLLGRFLFLLLTSLDLIKEEEKAVFFGPGPSLVYEYIGMELEPEQFSPDRDWMPSLVLIAKNSYVWLDQLSKKYARAITTLDQIPDEELAALARYGFTGLWLIGLWERSPASQRIKQLRGNPEAVASAYSLFYYDIANDLGGEEAYQTLRSKAWKFGIRLASDMVPNHMGIDSRWVIEHPNWFISLDYSPFPSYSFNGPNLSWDERVGIYLEDHYYNNSDAAVVFKRVDNWTGQEKFIYHGNDGTSFPWNDTAQLDYLNPEVREAVIQTILHVARKFPVIRFDAAMTLAKKHFQRLWYPEPGSGGDIPSRAEHGLTREQYDAAIPIEFWREVVDRVAQEQPDTLLLAEAFWLMEGYFVRTLGMHRVYNSAFMNMLRDEKNQEYRLVIKNTLEFDPEILKRYVNFMNNPDERTAVDQFGKGDKYIGICTLMATLPGLPMFGHGQIEGFTEKYGMEYRKAYWEESVDEYLVARHQREIFPLLRKRYLFAEAQDFLLYDFYTPDGYVNEDVFAYSNRSGDERALVVYHNKFASARGWIRISAAYPVKTGEGDDKVLVQKNLGEGLGLSYDEQTFCIFRDQVSGLEYIRSNRDFHKQGLYIELDAYKCQVFLNFTEVIDDESGQYRRLANRLNGRGVPNISEALKEMLLEPVLLPFDELVNAGQFRWLIDHRAGSPVYPVSDLEPILDEIEAKAVRLLEGINAHLQRSTDPEPIAAEVRREVGELLGIPNLGARLPQPVSRKADQSLAFLLAGSGEQDTSPIKAGDATTWGILLGWLLTRRLGEVVKDGSPAEASRQWLDEWLLGKRLSGVLRDLGADQEAAQQAAELVSLLIAHQDWTLPKDKRSKTGSADPAEAMRAWLADTGVQRFIRVNRYQDILYFNKEAFEQWLWWMFTTEAVQAACQAETPQKLSSRLVSVYGAILEILQAEARSGYQVDGLLSALQPESK